MVEGLPNMATILELLRNVNLWRCITLDTHSLESFQEVGLGGLPAS